MTELKLGLILGSTRENRQGEKVARWVLDHIQKNNSMGEDLIQSQLADLRDYPFVPYAYPEPPKAYESKYTKPFERAWLDWLTPMDGFILVTPEYNHGYSAVLKNALDHAYTPWNKKPVGFVSYGGSSGGVRAVQQLRQVVIELQMAPLRDEVNIPLIFKAFNESGEPNEPFHAKRLDILLKEWVWWAKTLKFGRE